MKSITAFLVVIFCITAARASELTNVIYESPQGWEKTQKAGRVYLTPPDFASGPFAIIIFPGVILDRDFRGWFEQQVEASMMDIKVRHLGQTEQWISNGAVRGVMKEVAIDDSNPLKRYMRFVGLNIHDHAEIVVAMYNGPPSLYRHACAFRALIRSLRFSDPSTRGVKPLPDEGLKLCLGGPKRADPMEQELVKQEAIRQAITEEEREEAAKRERDKRWAEIYGQHMQGNRRIEQMGQESRQEQRSEDLKRNR